MFILDFPRNGKGQINRSTRKSSFVRSFVCTYVPGSSLFLSSNVGSWKLKVVIKTKGVEARPAVRSPMQSLPGRFIFRKFFVN